MKQQLVSLIASLALSASVYSQSCVRPRPAPEGNLQSALDIEYVQTPTGNSSLDIYTPSDKSPHPLVVLIHGGSWMAGSKNDFRDDARTLAGMGYTAATIDYRLVREGTNRFPAAVEDVRCAIKFLKANADRYGIDRHRIAAYGFSAGGHLASMLGTSARVGGLDGTNCSIDSEDASVNSVVSYYAPLDLRSTEGLDFGQVGVILGFLGTLPEFNPRLATLASPVAHINAQTPPFFLVHGDADKVVPLRSSVEFVDALRQAGRMGEVVVMPGLDHGFGPFSDDPRLQPAMCSSLNFLQETLKK